MNRLAPLLLVLGLVPATAGALNPSDAGVYVALSEDGEPVRKILRVSQVQGSWRFEDRQPDGSWLDVSCHGGCEHAESTVDDLVRFFGSPPPPGIQTECVHNAQYAFCHLVRIQPGLGSDGYVLVVRNGTRWQPISMARLDDGAEPPPALEGAAIDPARRRAAPA